jgi:hypothetical protein
LAAFLRREDHSAVLGSEVTLQRSAFEKMGTSKTGGDLIGRSLTAVVHGSLLSFKVMSNAPPRSVLEACVEPSLVHSALSSSILALGYYITTYTSSTPLPSPPAFNYNGFNQTTQKTVDLLRGSPLLGAAPRLDLDLLLFHRLGRFSSF